MIHKVQAGGSFEEIWQGELLLLLVGILGALLMHPPLCIKVINTLFLTMPLCRMKKLKVGHTVLHIVCQGAKLQALLGGWCPAIISCCVLEQVI